MKIMKKSGLSLLEILVAMVILASVVAGLASVFVSAKSLLMHSRGKITAAEAAKYYLDPLQMEVSQKDWGTKCLSGASSSCPGIAQAIIDPSSSTSFTPEWNITPLPDPATIRRVKLKVKWTERSAE